VQLLVLYWFYIGKNPREIFTDMQQRTFTEEIKYQWNYGGPHIRLIGINLAVFIFIGTLLVIGRLFFADSGVRMLKFVQDIFTLHGNFSGFLWRPWGIVTSIFAHFDFFHFLFNMIFLYFASLLFLRYFSERRLMYTYIMGGLLGGVFQILAYSIIPNLQGQQTYVVGASGSVMAIFMAVAFYRPHESIRLFGILPVKLIWLALIFILIDFLRLGTNDNVAHFAHLGGIAFGIWSIQNLHSSNNIVTRAERFVDNWKAQNAAKKNLKVKKGGNQSRSQANKKSNVEQDEIDRILDKISKSGYDSLTKKEKETLFNQSKNG
jgi:membrane associated rhomboid family serine protease